LEDKLNTLVEKVTKIDTGSAQEVNRTVDQLNSKIYNLEAHVKQYMVVTEQQHQIITRTEEKLNQYIELINHQQQVIEFLLHKSIKVR